MDDQPQGTSGSHENLNPKRPYTRSKKDSNSKMAFNETPNLNDLSEKLETQKLEIQKLTILPDIIKTQGDQLTKLIENVQRITGEYERNERGCEEGEETSYDVNEKDWFMNLIEEEDQPLETDETMLTTIFGENQLSKSFGEKLSPEVANIFSKIYQQNLSKEKKEKLKEKYLVPENCKVIGVPKINPEIWMKLKKESKHADLDWQNLQSFVSKGIVAQGRMLEEVMKISKVPGVDVKDLLNAARDSFTFSCGAFIDLNSKRRMGIKPELLNEYAGICSATEATEFLFGDNLEDSLKKSKGTSKIVKEPFRGNSSLRSFGHKRFTPYHRGGHSGANSTPLNSFRQPFQQRSGFQQRGSFQQRGHVQSKAPRRPSQN